MVFGEHVLWVRMEDWQLLGRLNSFASAYFVWILINKLNILFIYLPVYNMSSTRADEMFDSQIRNTVCPTFYVHFRS